MTSTLALTIGDHNTHNTHNGGETMKINAAAKATLDEAISGSSNAQAYDLMIALSNGQHYLNSGIRLQVANEYLAQLEAEKLVNILPPKSENNCLGCGEKITGFEISGYCEDCLCEECGMPLETENERSVRVCEECEITA